MLLVDVLTWTVLVPMLTSHPNPTVAAAHRAAFASYESLVQHGANAVFVYVDLALTAGGPPLEPHYLGWVSLWSGLYAAWAVYYWTTTGVWLYPVRTGLHTADNLDWSLILTSAEQQSRIKRLPFSFWILVIGGRPWPTPACFWCTGWHFWWAQ